jgi:hypothetical protein
MDIVGSRKAKPTFAFKEKFSLRKKMNYSISLRLTMAKAPAHTAMYGSINKRQIGVPFGLPAAE